MKFTDIIKSLFVAETPPSPQPAPPPATEAKPKPKPKRKAKQSPPPLVITMDEAREVFARRVTPESVRQVAPITPEVEGMCLEWALPLCADKYAVADVKGRRIALRRLALQLKIGRPVARRESVAVSCGRRNCVNPDHMEFASGSWRQQRETTNDALQLMDAMVPVLGHRRAVSKLYGQRYSLSPLALEVLTNRARKRGHYLSQQTVERIREMHAEVCGPDESVVVIPATADEARAWSRRAA